MLEYNVRFGDPECQVVIPRLAPISAAHLAEAAAGKLAHRCGGASKRLRHGRAGRRGISGRAPHRRRDQGLAAAGALDGREGVPRRHHRRRPAGEVRTGGGRVLDVTAVGADLPRPASRAYEAAGRISWPGLQYRGISPPRPPPELA